MYLSVVVAHPRSAARSALARMVADLGWTVVGEAADGFEAVRLARSEHPDVLLVDGATRALDLAVGLETRDPATAPLVVRLIDKPQEHASPGGLAVLKGVPVERLQRSILDALAARRGTEVGPGVEG